jgi:hypothetical protein
MSKQNINVDDAIKTRTKRNHVSIIEDETLLQRIKEKQLLKQWKAERNAEKKTRLIVRKQAHDVSRGEKQRFGYIDESEYDERGYIEDRYVWKHEGCNAECKADNCQKYMLEYLYFELA